MECCARYACVVGKQVAYVDLDVARLCLELKMPSATTDQLLRAPERRAAISEVQSTLGPLRSFAALTVTLLPHSDALTQKLLV